MDIKTWDGISTHLGAVIGAGILALPFAVAKAGFVPGIVTIVVLGLVVMCLNLMVGEVALRTKGDHQLPGYAGIYLGKTGNLIMGLSMVVGIYGALVAYVIGLGETMSFLLGGSMMAWMLGAFAVFALVLAQRLGVIEVAERYLTTGKIIAITVIILIVLFFGDFSTEKLTPTTSWVAPFGVVLFAYLGTAVIPEVREELRGQWKKLKSVLLWSSTIAIAVYVLFAVAVAGVTGADTSEIATLSLGSHIGAGAVILLNIFAALALSSAFIALGDALKKMFIEDYKWPAVLALVATITVPLGIIVAGAHSFIAVLGITGALAGGLAGILIVLMFRKAQKEGMRRPEFSIQWPLAVQASVLAVFVFSLVWVLL